VEQIKRIGSENKVEATEMTVLWRNRPAYLPDPSRNGEMCTGLAGQLFLYGPGMQFAQADGKLMITLFDDTPRPPGQEPNKPEVWAFDKDTLRKLVTVDERFGKSYALFLPWPSYRADVTKIRVSVRYDPEEGHSLSLSDTKITIDTSTKSESTPLADEQPKPRNKKSETSHERMQRQLEQSEDLARLRDAWRQLWRKDQPSRLTPERITGGIQ
jgi:hypothetical protein